MKTKMLSSGAFPWECVTSAFIKPLLRPGPPVFWFTDRSFCSMRLWARSPASSHTVESISEWPGQGHVRGRPRSTQGGLF